MDFLKTDDVDVASDVVPSTFDHSPSDPTPAHFHPSPPLLWRRRLLTASYSLLSLSVPGSSTVTGVSSSFRSLQSAAPVVDERTKKKRRPASATPGPFSWAPLASTAAQMMNHWCSCVCFVPMVAWPVGRLFSCCC